MFFFKPRIHAYFVVFLKRTVHKWERRDSVSGPNDTKPSALERGGLGASFEPSSKLSSCLSIVLRLIELTVFLKIFQNFDLILARFMMVFNDQITSMFFVETDKKGCQVVVSYPAHQYSPLYS